MIQSELFIPAALEYKEKGLRQLQELDFEAAVENLAIAKEIDPYLADLDFLVALGEFARQHGIKPRSSPAKLAAFWRESRQAKADGDLSDMACQYLLQLIARRLLEIGQFTSTGFCAEKETVLHRGVLHIALKEWQQAHRELLNLVTAKGGEALALHWGYLGDAAYALRRWKDANMAYVCALFGNPQEIDAQMLQHPGLHEILQTLTRETGDANLARALWPIHAWMKNAVQIPAGNTFLLPLVRKQRSLLGSELLLEPKQRFRQFSLCLYIDQSGLHGEIQFDARQEMQNLDAELFSSCLREIERRTQQRS
jgi:tetratricopeptide (TPR) repeat protein